MSASPHGRTIARGAGLAALVAVAFALAGCVATPPAASPPATEQPAETGAPSASVEPASENDVQELTTSVTDDLLPGQCITGMPVDPTAGQSFTLIPCADQHNAEVIAVREGEEEEFPGAEALESQANSWCDAIMPAIADGVPESSVYAVVAPDEARWDDGDRMQLCFTVAIDAYYTGSFVGGNAEVHTS